MNAKKLAEYCVLEGFGVIGEDLFYSFIPESPDNCIAIFDTGGWAKDPDIPRKDKTYQFMVRGESYDSSREMADKIFDYFCPDGIPKKDFYIGEFFIHQALPTQAAPFHLGRDENDRDKFTINLTFIVD